MSFAPLSAAPADPQRDIIALATRPPAPAHVAYVFGGPKPNA